MFRPAQQISNIQLIYALIRGGEKICVILSEPMIADISSGKNLDENGIAHMDLSPTGDAAAGRGQKKNGMKKFVNKLGNMLSSVVKPDRDRDAGLPHVDTNTLQLPLVYIPLLIKRGIKWIEKTNREAAKPKKNIPSVPRAVVNNSIDKSKSSSSQPDLENASATASVDTHGTDAKDNEDDDENDSVQSRSANETVQELIHWIDYESQEIYGEDDPEPTGSTPSKASRAGPLEVTSPTAQSKGNNGNKAISIQVPDSNNAVPAPVSAAAVVLTYEEGPTPQDFFVPYLWSVVVSLSIDEL